MHITLPLLRPVIVVVLVLRTIEAFKVFDIIYVMTGGGPANGTQSIAFYTYQRHSPTSTSATARRWRT